MQPIEHNYSEKRDFIRMKLDTPVTIRCEGRESVALCRDRVALTKVSGSATPVPGGRSVSTDDRAFAGSSGVVQVNQSAGVGNQSMNTLSVRVME